MKYLCQRCIIRWSDNVRNNKRTRALRQSHRVVTIVLRHIRHAHNTHITHIHTLGYVRTRVFSLSCAPTYSVPPRAFTRFENREYDLSPPPCYPPRAQQAENATITSYRITAVERRIRYYREYLRYARHHHVTDIENSPIFASMAHAISE
ncbi:hypothetical protein ALC53_13570 [Atta colombica]|uniref:Uncharacterized protein n=1 Tax=Atta colombica TaxID=520822 RepID=A0A195AVN3_9HYME|nr:hypothetical protein ALC53_13570 [Atta colombica]